jgi:hypothetical protein
MITEAEEATEGTFIASVNAEHEEEVAGGYFETTRLRTTCSLRFLPKLIDFQANDKRSCQVTRKISKQKYIVNETKEPLMVF